MRREGPELAADLAELVERHQEMVFRTLARLVGDRQDLEDLAQEVFLRLFRGMAHFRGEAKVTTFLYRIIVNVVNDEFRRRQRARLAVSLDEEEAGWDERLPGPAPDPGARLDRARFEELLEASLDRLSPRERAVVTLFYQEERSYQEISEILETPIGTVKTHLYRAREKLKTAVQERISACPATL